MVYRAIGLQSDISPGGLEIVFVEFQEQAGKWSFEVLHADNYAYPEEWKNRLANAASLSAVDYQALHADYGQYTGQQVNRFIEQYKLQYKVALIASPGHTVFYSLCLKIPVQAGDGAAVAAATHLPVVSDFFSVDHAMGGREKGRDTVMQKLGMEQGAAVESNALLNAFMGVLRWRQEFNVFAAETGAARNSIGGALWTGQDA
jgi:anhydro-N-acetylmuramic acid kinase